MTGPDTPRPAVTHARHFQVAGGSLRAVRAAVREVEGFNAKLAVVITGGVGTMACAYVFAALALVSLPDAIRGGRPAIVSWVAQTFLQLVLLSVIMVGQRVASAAADERSARTFEDTERILAELRRGCGCSPRGENPPGA